MLAALPLSAGNKDKLVYGEGLVVSVPLPRAEVEQVVAEVAQSGLIRGTKEYNRDEYVAGAKPAESCSMFPEWKEGGKVFYKVRENALDPRNFQNSQDEGTLAVRYVVKAQDEKNTVLRIDALFQENVRRTIHKSSGSVESEEYADIREHLDAIELMKKEDAEARQRRQQQVAKKKQGGIKWTDTAAPADVPAESSSRVEVTPVPEQTVPDEKPPEEALAVQTQPGQTLEEHVKQLRKQLERVVKAPGAPLKAAPYHTANTLQPLSPGTEVLILISTPYWYGVETHDGQHGWIMRDELEQP